MHVEDHHAEFGSASATCGGLGRFAIVLARISKCYKCVLLPVEGSATWTRRSKAGVAPQWASLNALAQTYM